MTSYKPGDCVLIPFPFTNLASIKQRPAIVLSSENFNTTGQDIILAAVTSRIPDTISPWEYLIRPNELTAAGLPKASIVKLGKLVTLDQRLIRKKLGALPLEAINDLHQILGRLLA